MDNEKIEENLPSTTQTEQEYENDNEEEQEETQEVIEEQDKPYPMIEINNWKVGLVVTIVKDEDNKKLVFVEHQDATIIPHRTKTETVEVGDIVVVDFSTRFLGNYPCTEPVLMNVVPNPCNEMIRSRVPRWIRQPTPNNHNTEPRYIG